MMLSFGLSLLATIAAGGLLKQLFLWRYNFAGMYFNAIASTVLLTMAVSVVLAVFKGRPLLAPALTLSSAMLTTAIFYSQEAASFMSLIFSAVGTVAFITWLLAFLGCKLRQRLQHMD